jgi:cell division initiation protein
MIDLTPLDVRKKVGDFKKVLRGYEPGEVDEFLQLVAARFEELVKENITLTERTDRLQEQVQAYSGRETAVQEALVMAQKLREDIKSQVEREVQLAKQGAEADIRNSMNEAKLRLGVLGQALTDLERRRLRFLKSFRQMLQRELEAVEIEEARAPQNEAQPVELELGTRGLRDDQRSMIDLQMAAVDIADLRPTELSSGSATPAGEDASAGRSDAGEPSWPSPFAKESDRSHRDGEDSR